MSHETQALKPCPFCGAKVSEKDITSLEQPDRIEQNYSYDYSAVSIHCPNTNCSGMAMIDDADMPEMMRAKIIEKWNYRSESQPAGAGAEAPTYSPCPECKGEYRMPPCTTCNRAGRVMDAPAQPQPKDSLLTMDLMYRDNGGVAWWSVLLSSTLGEHKDGDVVQFVPASLLESYRKALADLVQDSECYCPENTAAKGPCAYCRARAALSSTEAHNG